MLKLDDSSSNVLGGMRQLLEDEHDDDEQQHPKLQAPQLLPGDTIRGYGKPSPAPKLLGGFHVAAESAEHVPCPQ